MILRLVALVLLVGLTACGGLCGGGEPPAIKPAPESGPVGTDGDILVDLQPTATPYPTFTPVPTQYVAPVPTPTPFGFPQDYPSAIRPPREVLVATPGPSPVALALATPVADAAVATVAPSPTAVSAEATPALSVPVVTPQPEATPYPTPYGQLDGGDDGEPVRFIYQSVFPIQQGFLPEWRLSGDIQDLPQSADFISTMAPYVGWVLAYDTLSAEDGWDFDGYIRWINNTKGLGPFVMYQEPVTLERGNIVLYRSLGRDVPGVWTPGYYRVQLMDELMQEVVGWDFEVR